MVIHINKLSVVPINKAEYEVFVKHTKLYCVFLYGCISTQLKYPVVMSILWQFVQNIKCDTKFYCFFLYGCIFTQLHYPVVMSILLQFVQNIKCDLSTRISDIKCANF